MFSSPPLQRCSSDHTQILSGVGLSETHLFLAGSSPVAAPGMAAPDLVQAEAKQEEVLLGVMGIKKESRTTRPLGLDWIKVL